MVAPWHGLDGDKGQGNEGQYSPLHACLLLPSLSWCELLSLPCLSKYNRPAPLQLWAKISPSFHKVSFRHFNHSDNKDIQYNWKWGKQTSKNLMNEPNKWLCSKPWPWDHTIDVDHGSHWRTPRASSACIPSPLVACQNLFFKANYYSTICIFHILLIWSFIRGPWPCSHLLPAVRSDAMNRSWILIAACTYFRPSTLSVLIVRLSWALETDSNAQSQLQESSSSMCQLDADKSHLAAESVLSWSKMLWARIKRGFPPFSTDTRREGLSLSGLIISVTLLCPSDIFQPSCSIPEGQFTLQRSWHPQEDG